jgi:hypothetical protein
LTSAWSFDCLIISKGNNHAHTHWYVRNRCARHRIVRSLAFDIVTTAVTGRAGQAQRLGDADDAYRAVRGIKWGEKGDKPCRIGLHRTHVNNLDYGEPYQIKCGGSDIGYDGQPILTPTFGEYVSGISVCLNRDRTRLKGVSIHTRRFDHKTDLVDAGGFANTLADALAYSTSRSNCDDFERFVDCPAAHLATAVDVHWDGDRDIQSIIGLALVCRAVKREHSGF